MGYVGETRFLVGTTTSQIGTKASPSYDLRMGETNHPSLDYYLNGGVDELRVSTVVRSENCIQLTYEMMINPSEFVTIGPEMPGPKFFLRSSFK